MEKLAVAAIADKHILIIQSGVYPKPARTRMPPRNELAKAPTWWPINAKGTDLGKKRNPREISTRMV